MPEKDFETAFNPETLSWIVDATADCCLQIVCGADYTESLEEEIAGYFEASFDVHEFVMPSMDSLSTLEKTFMI